MQRVARTYFTAGESADSHDPAVERAGGRADDEAVLRARRSPSWRRSRSAAAAAQTPLAVRRPAASAGGARVQFPPYEIRTLDNGLQVVAVLHHEQPVVSMRMIVRAGAAIDPRGKAGLADLAASLLDQGTTTRTAQ